MSRKWGEEEERKGRVLFDPECRENWGADPSLAECMYDDS
jgi:hypothetical protein